MTPAGGSAPTEATAARDTDAGPTPSPSVVGRRTGRVPKSVAVLEPFVRAGVFAEAEIQLTANVARLAPGTSDDVLLALALAARGPRVGHVCVLTRAGCCDPGSPGDRPDRIE